MKTKPFDLEAALNGAKVVTRTGHKVLHVWRDESQYAGSCVEIRARISILDDKSIELGYFANGRFYKNQEDCDDLFLLDESEDEPAIPMAVPVPDDLQYRLALRILSELKPDGDRSYNEALMHSANIVRGFK